MQAHLVFTSPILVLTEGKTDLELVQKIFEQNATIENKNLFQFHHAGSYEKVIKTIEFASANDRGKTAKMIGLMVDADNDPVARDAQLKKLANDGKYPFALHYLIVPSAQTAGAIETLALKTLDDDTLACSEAFVACIEKTTPLNPAQRDKLKLYAWTSQQEKEPVTNFMRVKNQSSSLVDVTHDAFQQIVTFLTQLAHHVH